jgi:hypothetical protein
MNSLHFAIPDKFYVSIFPKDVAHMRNTGNAKTKMVGRHSERKLPAKTSRSAKDNVKNNRKDIKCEVMFGAI